MISDEYRELNERLHESNPDYGTYGWMMAQHVMRAVQSLETMDVLDYGCGKATLNLNLPFGITCYDPAVPKYAEPPEPADIVVCADVLEHVEPEHLDEVMADLARLMKRFGLLMIHCRPAKTFLPDGRNAHISLHDHHWWLDRIEDHFDFTEHTVTDGLLKVAIAPKGTTH